MERLLLGTIRTVSPPQHFQKHMHSKRLLRRLSTQANTITIQLVTLMPLHLPWVWYHTLLMAIQRVALLMVLELLENLVQKQQLLKIYSRIKCYNNSNKLYASLLIDLFKVPLKGKTNLSAPVWESNWPFLLGSLFTVNERYTFVKRIGYGAYGVVCSATDSETQTSVAIKKIPKAFQDLVDAKRVLREIKILSKINIWPHML